MTVRSASLEAETIGRTAADGVADELAEQGWIWREQFQFPAMRPCVPEPPRWLPYLKRSYEVNWFSNFGPVVTQLETALTSRYAAAGEGFVSASNCTAAIAAALIASRITGRVAIPAFSFPATAAAVLMAGAQPVVLDVDSRTWLLSAAELEKAARTQRLAAVITVMPFGVALDLSEHVEIARRHDLLLISDNASGLGGPVAPLLNERCFEAYSMHATKPFAIGEGGAIRAAETELPALRRALNFGLEHARPFENAWGINGKLPEVCAAIGMAVLEDFTTVVAKRQQIASRYIEFLSAYPQLDYLEDATRGPWQGFPVLLPSGAVVERFRDGAAARGLNIRRYYRPTLEDWPRTTKVGSCVVARGLSDRMISLPIYSNMAEAEVSAMLQIVGELLDELLD